MRSGSQVLVQITIFPDPAGTSVRSTTSSTWSVENTATTMGSHCCAISAADPARPPICTSCFVRAESTSKPMTPNPAAIRRAA